MFAYTPGLVVEPSLNVSHFIIISFYDPQVALFKIHQLIIIIQILDTQSVYSVSFSDYQRQPLQPTTAEVSSCHRIFSTKGISCPQFSDWSLHKVGISYWWKYVVDMYVCHVCCRYYPEK